MSDFEEKLNTILSSPEAMAQVAALAQSLGAKEGEHREEEPSASPAPSDGLGNLLGTLDPSLIGKFLPLLSELNSPGNEQRQQFLYALRPFLKESRRDKVDRALQVARILHLGKQFLGTLGESSHV